MRSPSAEPASNSMPSAAASPDLQSASAESVVSAAPRLVPSPPAPVRSPQAAVRAAPAFPVRVRPKRPPPCLEEDPLHPSEDDLLRAKDMWQTRAMVDGISVLCQRYQDRPDVLVDGDLIIYYEKGDPTKRVMPDVVVAFGVGHRRRMSYRVWEEGKAPEFVLEVASESTWREDVGRKRKLYERLRVGEYWMFDPQGRFLARPLRGFALRGGRHEELPVRDETGALVAHSAVLGLDLRAEGERLRFRDPVAGEDLRTLDEAEARGNREAAARRKAERSVAEAQADAANARAYATKAETRVAELEAELRGLQAQQGPRGGRD